MIKEFVGAGTAQQILGLSHSGLVVLERVGRLTCHRTGDGRRLYLRADVEALAADRARAKDRRGES